MYQYILLSLLLIAELYCGNTFNISPVNNLLQKSLPSFQGSSSQPPQKNEPILQRVKSEPILIVNEPSRNCKVHLVGVSHGDPTSARLVESTIKSVRPSVIVLELCPDRFLALSLESSITPTNNLTMLQEYNDRKEKLQNYQQSNPSKLKRSMSIVKENVNFIKSQGIVAGSFLSMSVLLSIFQRVFGVVKKGGEEEFATAMRTAERLKIPIRLGDAPQTDTLQSLNKVINLETLNPCSVVSAFSLFAFSAFGADSPFLPWKTTKDNVVAMAGRNIQAIEEFSEWINIVEIYKAKKEMTKSLIPAVALLALAFFFGSIPEIGIAQDFSLLPFDNIIPSFVREDFQPLSMLESNSYLLSAWSWILKYVNSDSTQADLFSGFNYAIANLLSLLIMIRFAKLIGANRDIYIAKKVQEFCQEFPGAEVVVVIGMLHVNGVASWLAKGKVIDSLE